MTVRLCEAHINSCAAGHGVRLTVGNQRHRNHGQRVIVLHQVHRIAGTAVCQADRCAVHNAVFRRRLPEYYGRSNQIQLDAPLLDVLQDRFFCGGQELCCFRGIVHKAAAIVAADNVSRVVNLAIAICASHALWLLRKADAGHFDFHVLPFLRK